MYVNFPLTFSYPFYVSVLFHREAVCVYTCILCVYVHVHTQAPGCSLMLLVNCRALNGHASPSCVLVRAALPSSVFPLYEGCALCLDVSRWWAVSFILNILKDSLACWNLNPRDSNGNSIVIKIRSDKWLCGFQCSPESWHFLLFLDFFDIPLYNSVFSIYSFCIFIEELFQILL